MKDLENIARKWFAAFNARQLEALLALYADDAQHYSPKLKQRQPESLGLIKGKTLLRQWWRDSFDRLPELRYEPQNLISGESQIFMEYLRFVPGEETLMVGEVLEANPEGLIIFSRVYHG